MKQFYTMTVEPDGDTLLVTCRALPELTTFADDRAAVKEVGLMAVLEALSARMSRGIELPLPETGKTANDVQVEVPPLVQLKSGLYMAALRDGVTRSELARRLGVHREQVDRLFRLGHRSRLEQIQDAANALGLALAVDLRADAA